MAILGPEGLEKTAAACHANTLSLVSQLCEIKGVERMHTAACFHEAVLRLDAPAADVLDALLARGILGGYNMADDYPELGNAILVCATEMRSEDEIKEYVAAMSEILSSATTKASYAGAV
jgi:glycine dehydrogenase subunit 1